MSDLHTRLDEIAGPTVAPSASTVDADLSRGRRALRRRRASQIVGGSGLVVAAVIAAALAVPSASTDRNAAAPVASGGVAAQVSTRLVAYTGQQPTGFTLDQVPEGWVVQGVDKYVLTLAPKNATDKDPHSFIGKIAIALSDAVPHDVAKKDVRVGDKPGVLATMKGSTDGRTLFVKQPSGAYLTIQVWDGLGWGENDIVQFAVGVHVNDGAGVSVG